MTNSIAIIGSGISGAALAYSLTSQGYEVTIYERGLSLRDSASRFRLKTNLAWSWPRINEKLRRVTQQGENLGLDIQNDMIAAVGGMALFWEAITPRFSPNDFKVKTLYGREIDWPLDYHTLEPYYGQAERFIGVSGTDEDNPFAPPRSTPFPLPPFELGYFDEIIAGKVKQIGVTLHTTPQARTRLPYLRRLACQNIGICNHCPIDARYSPIHHLEKANSTGLLSLQSETTVRKIIVNRQGTATGLLVQRENETEPREVDADLVIIAGGAIETARLLLLSHSDHFPNGLGNDSGHVGRNLVFHQIRGITAKFKEKTFRGRAGFWTAQSMQFADHDKRSSVGGFRIEASDVGRFSELTPFSDEASDMLFLSASEFSEIINGSNKLYQRRFSAVAESDISERKYITLSSDEKDSFGDPVAHVVYDLSDFDYATFEESKQVISDMVLASEGEIASNYRIDRWGTGHHHMGTTRMASSENDGVSNEFGQVYGTENVYVTGPSTFPNTFSPNPTLTHLALTLRTKDYLLDQVLISS